MFRTTLTLICLIALGPAEAQAFLKRAGDRENAPQPTAASVGRGDAGGTVRLAGPPIHDLHEGALETSLAGSVERLSISEIGPETGYSGSGSGFTFNADTRQVILPSEQRVFRTLNGGSSWSPLYLPLYPGFGATEGSYFVRQSSQDPGVLFAVGAHEGRLGRSDDFGATWTLLGDEEFYNVADVAIHQADPDVILVLRRSSDDYQGPALWRSEDGGATFAPQWESGLPNGWFDWETGEGCFPTFSNIATTPADPSLVYVVQLQGEDLYCPPGVHKSTDGGRTFTRLEAAPWAILQVFPHPTRPGTLFAQRSYWSGSSLFRSTDGGESFESVEGGLTSQSFFASFDRNQPSRVYVAGRAGVFRSEDGGETFEPLGLTAEQTGRFATNVDVDPANSDTIYVNTFNGNFKSGDGGATFHAINSGWRAAHIWTIAIDSGPNPALYVATDHGLLRTRTRGRRYERIEGPDTLDSISMLAVAPSDPDVIFARVNRPVVAGPFAYTALLRSLDGGRTWSESDFLGASVLPMDIAVDPSDWSRVYLSAWELDWTGFPESRGLFRSEDAGASFEWIRPLSASAVAINPQDGDQIYFGLTCDGSCWPLSKTEDGGFSVEASTADPLGNLWPGVVTFDLLIDPLNPSNLFLGGAFSSPEITTPFLRSTDGGFTLDPAEQGPVACDEMVLHPENPSRLYCWAFGWALDATSDGGESWHSMVADDLVTMALPADSTAMAIHPTRPNLLYLLGGSLVEVEVP